MPYYVFKILKLTYFKHFRREKNNVVLLKCNFVKSQNMFIFHKYVHLYFLVQDINMYIKCTEKTLKTYLRSRKIRTISVNCKKKGTNVSNVQIKIDFKIICTIKKKIQRRDKNK